MLCFHRRYAIHCCEPQRQVCTVFVGAMKFSKNYDGIYRKTIKTKGMNPIEYLERAFKRGDFLPRRNGK